MPPVEGIPLSSPQSIVSTLKLQSHALGDVTRVRIATAVELVLAGDLEASIKELTRAQGNLEADRLRAQWEALRLNRQGMLVLGVAQEIAQALGSDGSFEKLEQAIASGKSFAQAHATLSTEEAARVAKSLGGSGFVTQLLQISSASNLEILSQQLLALASAYGLNEGHEAGALVIYQALSGGLMGLAKGKVVDDANVALSVMQGKGEYKVAEVVHAARGLQGRLGSPNTMGMLITGGLLSRLVKGWMMGKGIGLVEGVSQARAWEFLSATTATAAEVTYVTGWMEMSQHGEINWDSYWKTWAHNAIIFGGVRAGVGMGLAGREAIHGMSAAGLATRHFEYLKVTEGIARHAVPIASLTVLDKAVDPNGKAWFSTAVHATATTAELNAAGYLGRAAIPKVHRFETRQAFKERLYRGIARNPQLTRIYQHAGRNLPAFLNASPIPQPWQSLAVGAGYTLDHSYMMAIGLPVIGLDPLSTIPVRIGVRLFMEDKLTLADPVLPDYSPAALRFMPGTKMVYLGGLGNIFPRSLFLDEIHRLSGQKVVVVSTAKGKHKVKENDSHAIVGPYEHHSDSWWNRRVAMVVERLYQAIEAGHFDDTAIKRIILWGHSMGGLFNYALGVIAQTVRADGVLPDRIYREFPGLSKVHLHKVSAVAGLVQRSKLVGVGDPLEGVPVPLWLKALDYVAAGGMHRPFKPTYLQKVYERTGFRPNQLLDLSIHTRLNGVRARPRSGNGSDSWMDDLGDTAFKGVAVALDNDGDRVVPRRRGLFQAKATVDIDDLDHVDHIRSPVFLGKFLATLAEHFGDRP